MSNWNRWAKLIDNPNSMNFQFAKAESSDHPDRFAYPNLRDGSDIVLGSDYSGEHARPEFQVLSFLLTTKRSVFCDWEPARMAVRRKLPDGRRMSFKDLNDALRINTLAEFLEAASLLNGLLVCVAVQKSHTIPHCLPNLMHDWTPDTLQKLLRICVFGGAFVDGLRALGQRLHWITDDDSIVANDDAKHDAASVMGGLLQKYDNEDLEVGLGIASSFKDDDMRAEDLVAIPDLAAGAFSEGLCQIGKENIPVTAVGESSATLYLQTKSTLITAWRLDHMVPLRHLSVVVRDGQVGGETIISFCQPFVRRARPGEALPALPALKPKWERALKAELERRGVHPSEILESPTNG
jgi:hypothetical protein